MERTGYFGYFVLFLIDKITNSRYYVIRDVTDL